MAMQDWQDKDNWGIESTPTNIDYFHKLIKTQFFQIAKTSKNEQEVRSALIACSEFMTIVGEARLNALNDEPNNTFYHRQLRTVINHAKQAKSALRTALAGIHRDQRMQAIQRKSENVVMSPEVFKLFNKAYDSFKAIRTPTNNNKPNAFDSLEDELAESAIGRLKARLAKGESLQQIANSDKAQIVDDSQGLMDALKNTAENMDRPLTTDELFKPDENGEVEL